MLRRGAIRYLSLFEIFLIISLSFSLSFILNSSIVSSLQPSANLIPNGGRGIRIGETFMNIKLDGQPVGVKYLGPADPNNLGGLQKGLLKDGREVTWSNINPSQVETFTPSPDVAAAWGKPFSFSGNDYALADAISNPSSVPGLLDANGKLTTEGAKALSDKGIINPTVKDGKVIGEPQKASPGLLGTIFGRTPFGITGTPGFLLSGLIWGATAAAIAKIAVSFFGGSEQLGNALAISAFGGFSTFRILQLKVLGEGLSKGALPLGLGLGVGIALFILTYKKEKKKLVKLECLPWEPPIGGAKCEECNKDPFRPCSEYRCKALGQACGIVNPGTSEEKCVWLNPKDVTSPTITPWDDALNPEELSYIPDNAIRPPNRGVRIVRPGNNCLLPYTPLEFGIITNEPAQCKLDFNRNKTFDEMEFYFGETNYFLNNNTQKMRLPGAEDLQGSPLLQNDGTFSLFVRCQDANGNDNIDVFAFTFCVDPSPDTTPPLIEGTSLPSGSYVRYNADSVPIELYTNEPSECKWSRQDKAYEDMENTMKCDTESFQVNANLQYTCRENVTGIKNQEDNKFYFRCKDQPGKAENVRNTNRESFALTLKGSQPLNIIEINPNGTLSGSGDVIPIALEVKTDDGAEEGKSICYFSATGEIDSYIPMFETNSFEHRQPLDLTAGNYDYYFRCIDSGGNAAESLTGFTILVDKNTPSITRVYQDIDALKVVTDEDAQCVYSLQNCNYAFKDGIAMLYSSPSSRNSHFAKWESNSIYYIKCKDDKGNEPAPNSCSIIASAVDLTREVKK